MLRAHKWYAYRNRRTFYAQRHVYLSDGRRTANDMHRLVLARKLGRPIADGKECDHDDGNGLNNQRSNLFEATSAQNKRNLHRRKVNSSSQYLGVCWDKCREKWQASIKVNRKCIYFSRHATELEAAQAREAYITAHPELMARSNFTERRETT